MTNFTFSLKELAEQFSISLICALILLLVGYLLIRGVEKILKRVLARSTMEKAAHNLILSFARVSMYTLLALSVASTLGINISGIVALGATLTLALSLSLQNLVTNILSGFTVLNTAPFHSGDFVEIDGLSGTVKEISMSYTRLITPDNKLISVPNSTVTTAKVINYSAQRTRRIELTPSAGYDAPTRKVMDALLEAAQAPTVLSEPAAFAGVKEYGDHAISYTLWFWTNGADYWESYYTVNARIKDIFDREGIQMTYPHLNVHADDALLQALQHKQ